MKFQDTLNPKLWNLETNDLQPEVKSKLEEIANAFIEYIEIPQDAILDMVITGSSASYNYNDHSDLDLHIIVDYDKIHDDCPLVEGYLGALKNTFNKEHDIFIHGVPVELYAEQKDQGTVHNGLYSLKTGWIDKPQKIEPTDNDAAVEAKYNEIKEMVDKCNDSEEADELLEKIYNMRKAGLAEAGEFCTENLAFKKLRNEGCMDKLRQIKKEKIDKQLSLESYQLQERDKSDYLNTEDRESALRKFLTLHANLIEPLPEPYDGDRDLEAILYYLGSTDGLVAKVITPIETIIFNSKNLKHLLDENEPERLADLSKIKATLKNPNLVIETNEGKIKHNYIKAFGNIDLMKAQLVVVKVLDDGTFYVTTFRLKNRKFLDKLKEGQIIYDLSDTYANKDESLSYNNIINNFSKRIKYKNIREEYMNKLRQTKKEKIDKQLSLESYNESIKEEVLPHNINKVNQLIDRINKTGYFKIDGEDISVNNGFGTVGEQIDLQSLAEQFEELGFKVRTTHFQITVYGLKDFINQHYNKNESIKESKEDTSKYRVYSYDIKDGWDILGHYDDEYSAEQVYDAWKLRLKRNNGKYGIYRDVKLLKPGQKNESIKEDYEEDDCEDIPEEMHKERYVTYFETQEGRQKYTIYHVYTDSTDDSYNELCDKRDNQLGMYNSYKELKDALKERAEKIAKQQGWTVKSIDNLGEDDEYYRERNKSESWDTYAVQYQVFNNKDELVTKQKEFKTEKAMNHWIKKQQDNPKFNGVLATSSPINESIINIYKELNKYMNESLNEKLDYKEPYETDTTVNGFRLCSFFGYHFGCGVYAERLEDNRTVGWAQYDNELYLEGSGIEIKRYKLTEKENLTVNIQEVKNMLPTILADGNIENFPVSQFLDLVNTVNTDIIENYPIYWEDFRKKNITESSITDNYQARINAYGNSKVRFTDLENSNYAYEDFNTFTEDTFKQINEQVQEIYKIADRMNLES